MILIMAKRTPIDLPNERFITPIDNGRVVLPHPLLLRDGVLITQGDQSANPIVTAKNGVNCCCDPEPLDCGGCCTSDYDASGQNCCYSFAASPDKDTSIQVLSFHMRELYKRWSTTGELTAHELHEATQNGDVFRLITDGGGCSVDIPVFYQREDYLDNESCSDPDDSLILELGPRLPFDCDDRRLWRAPFNFDGHLCGHDWNFPSWDRGGELSRCQHIPDQSTDCFTVSESIIAMSGDGRRYVEWTMSFAIQLLAGSCNGNCRKCN